MDKITEESVLPLFDELVAEGKILYEPPEKYTLRDGGYPFEFRICPALAAKPNQLGDRNNVFGQDPLWGEGSDMFRPDERLILTKFNGTHDIALNVFCEERPQLLMPTIDSYKRQHEPLDLDDIKIALEVLKNWKGWYIIYNCGIGCSRKHKHLQALKGPPRAFVTLVREDAKREGVVPYKYFLHCFERGFENEEAASVLEKYLEMLARCRDALGLGADEDVPHNVVLYDQWLVVIPRKSNSWQGVGANTAGMLGCIQVKEKAEVEKWEKAGCADVLRNLGLSS